MKIYVSGGEEATPSSVFSLTENIPPNNKYFLIVKALTINMIQLFRKPLSGERYFYSIL